MVYKKTGGGIMCNYKEMYFELFNKVTDAIEVLQEAQREVELKYMSIGEQLLKEEKKNTKTRFEV